MTDKLFYKNPYQYDFIASVISAEEENALWKVELNQTAFYPEGGGQPADRGTLDGIEVVDVQKVGDRVFHFLKERPTDDEIAGKIDRDFRMEYMQQHTGQHILSAVLKRVAGAATVAVHQAEDYTSIEIDHSEFSDEQIEEIEEEANRMVCANHPVYSYLNGSIPIDQFPIRRETKYTENVRLVQIGGESLEEREKALRDAAAVLKDDFNSFTPGLKDLAACGGVHTRWTGEVGLIKFRNQEKVRGRLRLFWLIGKRAYRDYREKTELTDRIGDVLSVPLSGIGREFDRLLESLGAEKKKNNDLLKEMAFLKAEEIRSKNRSGKLVFVLERIEPAYFKQIGMALSGFEDVNLCLFNMNGQEGQWTLVSHKKELDFNRFRSEILSPVDGKGGGRAPLWQGKAGNREGLEELEKRLTTAPFFH
jgi:alanyl-tRNA synthetase